MIPHLLYYYIIYYLSKKIQFFILQCQSFKETKVIGEIQKSLRSRLLKIFEDLMGKRPALEIEIMMIN
jgi:hypothetical protein